MNGISKDIHLALTALADEEKRKILPRFFKTGKGQYGEGDNFIGVTVPNIRQVALKHKNAELADIKEMLASPWHEIRTCALFILVLQSKKEVSKEIFDFYLSETSRINNWDLVDLSAPQIVGKYLMNKPHDILYQLAESTSLWENRIAVVSTFHFIKQ